MKESTMKNTTGKCANVITWVSMSVLIVGLLFLPYYQQVCLGAETAQASTEGSEGRSTIKKSSGPERIKRLIKMLDLDKNQQAQIWQTYNQARERIIAMAKSGAGMAEIDLARQEARETIRAKVRGLLTPQQKKKYRELMSSD
jgi:Spy/CpxP family protein refolding chaperone